MDTIMETDSYITTKIESVFNALDEKNVTSDPISSIMKYIHENYMDVDLSLPKISENTYLTPAYICTIFKEHTGTTINKYITEYRLDKAKALLKDNNMKINDIGAKVGYSDGNYFAKIFRKETGLTPSDYRKKFLL
jgi:two-component system response regulator YesN